jgi:cytochrome c oxidase cbb3-type subunit 3
VRVALPMICALTLSACQREDRDYRPVPPVDGEQGFERYGNNAYALSEGKRLFQAMNCRGCHADGGGGIGPPLMDEKWLYGSQPDQVLNTIAFGRPGGMPAFGGTAREPDITVVGTLPKHQLLQLTAYVRSMSGLSTSDAAPGRSDHMSSAPPEQNRNPETPTPAPPEQAQPK